MKDAEDVLHVLRLFKRNSLKCTTVWDAYCVIANSCRIIFLSPENVAEQTVNDGQSLLDEMSRPIKNAFGKDITPDYAAHIKRIRRSLEELQERKMRCDELADVRRLKLQQLLQLRTCERDCDQVRESQTLCLLRSGETYRNLRPLRRRSA